ncbi:MAG TPA: hypothetical protein PLU24_03345 [Candidatus Omnitrophota bacterium]|nr:hypothetical protein [Candidatus Omnitrophota bacterium]
MFRRYDNSQRTGFIAAHPHKDFLKLWVDKSITLDKKAAIVKELPDWRAVLGSGGRKELAHVLGKRVLLQEVIDEFNHAPVVIRFVVLNEDLLIKVTNSRTGRISWWRFTLEREECMEKMGNIWRAGLAKREFSGNYYTFKHFSRRGAFSLGPVGQIVAPHHSDRMIEWVTYKNGTPWSYKLEGEEASYLIHLEESNDSSMRKNRLFLSLDHGLEHGVKKSEIETGAGFEMVDDLDSLAFMSQIKRNLTPLQWELVKRMAIFDQESCIVYESLQNSHEFKQEILDAGLTNAELLDGYYQKTMDRLREWFIAERIGLDSIGPSFIHRLDEFKASSPLKTDFAEYGYVPSLFGEIFNRTEAERIKANLSVPRLFARLGFETGLKMKNAIYIYNRWQRNEGMVTNPGILGKLAGYFSVVKEEESELFNKAILLKEKDVRRIIRLQENLISPEICKEIFARIKKDKGRYETWAEFSRATGIPKNTLRNYSAGNILIITDTVQMQKLLNFYPDLKERLDQHSLDKIFSGSVSRYRSNYSKGDEVSSLSEIGAETGMTHEGARQKLLSVSEKREKIRYLTEQDLIEDILSDDGFFYELLFFYLLDKGVDFHDQASIRTNFEMFMTDLRKAYLGHEKEEGIDVFAAAIKNYYKNCVNAYSSISMPKIAGYFESLERLASMSFVKEGMVGFYKDYAGSLISAENLKNKIIYNQWIEHDPITPSIVRVMLEATIAKKINIRDVTPEQAWALSCFYNERVHKAVRRIIAYRELYPLKAISRELLNSREFSKIGKATIDQLDSFFEFEDAFSLYIDFAQNTLKGRSIEELDSQVANLPVSNFLVPKDKTLIKIGRIGNKDILISVSI